MQARQIANRLWEGLASPRTALLVLVFLSLLQVAALVLPQVPVSSSQSATYNRWLAEFRPRLGPQTGLLASMGLLTVRSSVLLRATLGILGLLVAVNITGLWEAPREQTRPRRASYGLIAAGGILVISGWMIQMLWGWREPSVIAWPGAEIPLPQHALTLEQPQGALGIWQGKVGLYILNRGQRIGLEIHATQAGAPLLLLPAVNVEPEEVLRLALTTQAPEAFFATEEAALIFRLVQTPDAIQIEVYQSPSGEIVAEASMNRPSGLDDKSAGALVLYIGDTQVAFTPVLLPNYEIIYNPGAVFEIAGMLCLAVGIIIRMGKLPSKRLTAQEE